MEELEILNDSDPTLTMRFKFWMDMLDASDSVSEEKKCMNKIKSILQNPTASLSQLQYFIRSLSSIGKDDVLSPEEFDTLCCELLKKSKEKKGFCFNQDDYYRLLACITSVTEPTMRSHELAKDRLSNVPNAYYYDSEAKMDLIKSNVDNAKKRISDMFSDK